MSDLTTEAMAALTDLRAVTLEFFNDKKLHAKRIIEVEISEQPARVLSYALYGTSDLGKRLATLNSDINVSNLKGEVSVLTA